HHDRVHAGPGARQHANHVGQVVLALVVIGADLAEGRPQAPGGEAVHRGVDLGDLLLGVARVAILDDTLDPPALAKHAPIALAPPPRARQPPYPRGAARAGVPPVAARAVFRGGVTGPLDRLAGRGRQATGRDQDRRLAALGACLQEGVAAAEALGLDTVRTSD